MTPSVDGHFAHALGEGLTQDFSVQVVTCPPSTDHPDCRRTPASGLDVSLDSGVVTVGPALDLDFSLIGLSPGTADLYLDADNVSGSTFSVTVEPILHTRIKPLSGWMPIADFSADDRELLLVGSEVLVDQAHFSTGSPNLASGEDSLLGRTKLILDPGDTRATLSSSEVPYLDSLNVGDTVGTALVSTMVGGKFVVDVVSDDLVDGFSFGLRGGYADFENITWDVGVEETILLVPYTNEARIVFGNGGSVPEILISNDSVLLGTETQDWTFGLLHQFVLVANTPGTSTVTIRWVDHEESFRVIVPVPE